MKLIFAISIVALSFFGTACRRSVGEMILVPMPQEATFTGGYFETDSARFVERAGDGYVACRIDPSAPEIRPEGYRLKVTRRGIDLTALDSAGLFYGRQTLCLLATAQGIPCVEIIDNPCFGYRGIHLDVSRHFFPVETLFRLLDEMARYKLNKFHFHLADNGGWRIRIDAYPLLTRLGAFRTESDWLEWWSYGDRHYVPEDTPGAYGGYYTKEEIRRIVAYAAERFIEVIPEIEFPGHSDEVFAAYPELCCSGRAYTSGEFCVGNPLSLKFMDEVLTEVLELFPSKYIHIGGDEADRTAWKSCPRCRHLARELGGVDQVQCYLVEHAEKFLAEHGRTMIGWDEILKNNLRSTSTVISYRGQRGGIEAANRGYDVVMSPGEILYFDWYQADPHTQPRAMGGFSPIRKMYGFHPVPDTPAKAADNESIIRGEFVSPDSVEYIYDGGKEHVIGVQGCTWTEFIETEKHLEYMIFPRLLAVSELAWTPRERREWNDFRRRINVHVSLLHARGINAFPLSDDVVITAQMLSEGKKARVTLDTEKYPAEVRYTLDGTAPVPGSDLYDGPFVVKAGTTVRAALFVAGRMEGTMTELYVDARRNVDNYYTYLNTPEVYASTDR